MQVAVKLVWNEPINDSALLVFFYLNIFLSLGPHYEAQENLFKHPWLKTYDVFRKTTENIRVTVIPAFMGIQV